MRAKNLFGDLSLFFSVKDYSTVEPHFFAPPLESNWFERLVIFEKLVEKICNLWGVKTISWRR